MNSRPACVIVAYHGYHKVPRILFDKMKEADIKKCIMLKDDGHGKRTILHEIVRKQSPKLNNRHIDENMDYEECLKLLFNEKKGVKMKISLAKQSPKLNNRHKDENM